MSDDERVSMEELDAQLEMEAMDAAAEKKDKQQNEEEEEEEEEEEQKEKAPRDDSDDNSEKSDEAIEDNEEPEVDGDSREPSDGESIDGESGEEEESETEHEKRIRKSAALQFLDLEADEGTEKKIIKHLKKKIATDEDDAENAYEMDSIMDPEGEVVYDTDYELERKKKKKKDASDKKNKNKEDKNPKKRRRIRSPSPSDESDESGDGEEEEEEEEQKEEKAKVKKKKAIALDVSDDEMANMQTLGGTGTSSSAQKVGGQAPRPKAAFHDHSDIAKAAAEKKSKKVSAASLLDSPKQKPKAKPSAAANAAAGSKSPAKKPRATKPRAPTLQVGEQFELKERGAHKVYRITFRGQDTPLVMGPTSNKLELQPGVFHPRFFSTARELGETENGEYEELDQFQLFFVLPGRLPKKVGAQWATSGWNTFNSMSSEEQYAYVIDALDHNNIVPGLDEDGNNTKRMMFTEPLMRQIKSEAVLNPNGEWKWMPKHIQLPDLITRRDENGEPAVKAAAAAAAGPSAKKKAGVQAKPKIDRVKETKSHDVNAMLSKVQQQQQQQVQNKRPAVATEHAAAAWTSSGGSSSKKLTIDSKPKIQSSNDVLDFFSASPEPPQDLFDNEATLERTKQLLAELIDMRHRRLVKMGNASTAGEEIQKSFAFMGDAMTQAMDSDANFADKCKAFDEATEKIKGLQLLLIALPFFNAEAAQMMRDKLARM